MKIHFQASPSGKARKAMRELTQRYGQTKTPEDADVLVSLGGDGQTLLTLQDAIRHKKPVFGLNFGRVGFLQNLHDENKDLPERIGAAETVQLSPLRGEITLRNGNIKTDFAINEFHVCNHDRGQGIYLRVFIDKEERIARLGGDGLIVATTVGSTGYNKSAQGAILPLGDDIIAITPNNVFMPERLRPSIIRPSAIHIEVLEPRFRRSDVYADAHCAGRAATEININLDTSNSYTLLFDRGYGLHEKIMRTQFCAPGGLS